MLRASLTGFVLALSARAAAEPAEARWETGVDLHGGLATTPFYTENLPEATGHGLVLVGRVVWHEEHGFDIGLSVPVTAINVRQPAGSYVNEAAWGNPILWVERGATLGESQVGRFAGWLRAGVGAPLAESGPRLLRDANRALAIADAIDGWQDRELFAPGLVPLPVTAGLALASGILRTEAGAKLVPMLRIDDASLDPADTHPLTLSILTAAGASVWPGRSVGYGARTWLTVDAIAPAKSSRAKTLQWVVSPGLTFRIGERVKLGTEIVLPIAGALGGESFGVGVHASALW